MRNFKHEQTTTATKSDIWRIWEDVDNWHVWDTELESAELEGTLGLGTSGKLKPKQGPSSRFAITEYTAGESFTFTVNLPLARLNVAHYFLPGETVTFVHDVSFTGLLGGVFGRVLGGTYKTALPGVLARIKALAEQ